MEINKKEKGLFIRMVQLLCRENYSSHNIDLQDFKNSKSQVKNNNYIHRSCQLLCIDDGIDGLTRGRKYKMVFEDSTHYRISDDYGIASLYSKERFMTIQTQ